MASRLPATGGLMVCICIVVGRLFLVHGSTVVKTALDDIPVEFEHEPDHKHESAQHNSTERYPVAQFDWEHVAAPYTITLWILLASVAKIGFHLSKRFTSIFPDSSLLIVLGLVIGLVLYFINSDNNSYFMLNSKVFFLYLLPPIVFDAGYFMPNRAFFDNIGTILTYAVIGTVWNAAAIGLSLWAVSLTGLFHMETPLLSILLFSSLISAVDPVAVLVVFEEIHVNEILYIVVFGESLLNDAITVVLYHLFEGFSHIGMENLTGTDITNGVVSFFVVGLGGVAIGLVWAVITGFTTRWTKHVRVLEPLFVFAWAFSSYLTAEMLHLSGILAIVFCGIAMKQYVEGNISHKSQTTVKYFLKMLSSCSETIIFMFLGLSTVSTTHHWDTAFVGLTVLFCLVYRSIGVVIQTFFVNKLRLVKFNKVDQFIMAYGGLRGAIAYGLVVALDENVIKAKQMYVTATIVVIYFTVFLQGMTIKPLVNFLKVKKDDKREKSMNEQIAEKLFDHVSAGVEGMLGHKGHHWLRDRYYYYNNKYLKPLLLREASKQDTGIIEAYTKINVREMMDHLARTGSFPSWAALQTNSISTLIRSQSQSAFGRNNSGSQMSADQLDSPCLDMNVFDVIASKKLEADSRVHHLLLQSSSKPKSKPRFERSLSEIFISHQPPKRHAEQYPLRRLVKEKMLKQMTQVENSTQNEEDSKNIKKQVSFFMSDEEKTPPPSRQYMDTRTQLENFVIFHAPHVYVNDEDAPVQETILTAVEKELPWKRRSTTPSLEEKEFSPENAYEGSEQSIVTDETQPANPTAQNVRREKTTPDAKILIPMDEKEELDEEYTGQTFL